MLPNPKETLATQATHATWYKNCNDSTTVIFQYSIKFSISSSKNGLLLGVENTVDVKQLVTKGQKNKANNKNNRFMRGSSIVTYPVSSTSTRSLKM